MTNQPNSPALVVLKGPAKDKVFPLGTNLITLGRDDAADIRLAGDKSISRIHLSLRLVDNRYVLSNRSDNGTLVNGKLAEEKELRNGDQIRIGDSYLLEFSDGSKPLAAPSGGLFRKPAVLAMCGVYALAIVGAAIFLSNAPEAGAGLDSARVVAVLQDYGRYMTAARLSPTEQEARQAAVRAYVRAGFIAEREGNYAEARRVYLRVMDYTRDGQNPVYQYALERLRSVPAPAR